MSLYCFVQISHHVLPVVNLRVNVFFSGRARIKAFVIRRINQDGKRENSIAALQLLSYTAVYLIVVHVTYCIPFFFSSYFTSLINHQELNEWVHSCDYTYRTSGHIHGVLQCCIVGIKCIYSFCWYCHE